MEAKTDLQNYIEQGRRELAYGRGREAAIAFAHGAQIEPTNPGIHLGLAEANLALTNYRVVKAAAQKVIELQPENGPEAKTAQALLDILEHRYDRALKTANEVSEADPSNAYLHALRAYLLDATGQDYDAKQARARAMRQSFGGRFEHCFPPLPAQIQAQKAAAEAKLAQKAATAEKITPEAFRPQKSKAEAQEQIPSWRTNPLRTRMIRTRFFLNQSPGFVTNMIIAFNIILFLLGQMNPLIIQNTIQLNPLIQQGEIWRLFTGIFFYLPANGINGLLGFAISMFSLFFIGRAAEIFYGQFRYILVYLLSALAGSLICFVLYLITDPSSLLYTIGGLGPSGALLGIFGALGVFYLANRSSLGVFGTSALMNWGFWLILNLALAGSPKAIVIEIICLVASMGIAYLLLPRTNRRSGLF